MKFHYFCAATAIAFAASANAAGLPDLKKIAASVDGEYLSYSGPYGSRRMVNAETRVETGSSKLVLGVSQGTRKTDDDRFSATRVSASLSQDWSSSISTRTYASLSGNAPVFVTRELGQDISFKPLPETVLTAGGRYARYFGDVDVLSWSLRAAQYFHGGMVSYRFSSFDVQHLGHSNGHLVNVKLDDPYGTNELWLGHGTALHDAIWLSTPMKGKYSNVELRRVQPIGGGVGVMLGLNRIWYETDNVRYHGTGIRFGLNFASQGPRR